MQKKPSNPPPPLPINGGVQQKAENITPRTSPTQPPPAPPPKNK